MFYHKPRLDITVRSTWEWGLSRPKLLTEEEQKVERESDGNRGTTRVNGWWRAPVLCQSLFPCWHMLPLTTVSWDGSTLNLIIQLLYSFSTLHFHSTEIGVSWSNCDSYSYVILKSLLYVSIFYPTMALIHSREHSPYQPVPHKGRALQ